MYFFSYYLKHDNIAIRYEPISLINNDFSDKHPLIWEDEKNTEHIKNGSLSRVKIIWWKELTNEEAILLGLNK